MNKDFFAYDEKQNKQFFDKPISVSEYILVLNKLLSSLDIKIIGEVSEMKVASSGHVYFSLKDEKNGEVINCAFWSSLYRMCGVRLENGMQIIVSGNADIYPVRGSLTFKVRTVELVGEGALKRAYDELKKKLQEEGVFDKNRKREIPKYPQKIGVITSLKGAAVHDFINNLGRFGFKVYLCDSRVEGQEAVEDLLRSIKTMRKKEIDVLVIIRGGGSLQSLMAFDNEALLREVVRFPVPVVAGIGHHEDITLVALASDASESTPTATANFLSKGFQTAKEKVFVYQKEIEQDYERLIHRRKKDFKNYIEKIIFFLERILESYKKSEEKIKTVVSSYNYLIEDKKNVILNKTEKIRELFEGLIQKKEKELKRTEDFILSNDPKKQLALGYAIMKKNGKIIKDVFEVKVGEEVDVSLFRGEVSSKITKINKK